VSVAVVGAGTNPEWIKAHSLATLQAVVKLNYSEIGGGTRHWSKLQCYTKNIVTKTKRLRPYIDDLLQTI